MPPTVIPYASAAPYDNSAYVTRMADLMLRRGDLQADALRRAGDARAQMWGNVGNVALSTMGQIGAARDAERQRAILQQQQAFENQMKERDYDMREREMLAAADERKAGREWQQQQFRDTQARYSADDLAPGSVVSPEGYQQDYAGTSAARRFEHRDAEAARLPARSTVDGMLVPGFRAQNPNDELITDDTMGSTISPDIAARPDRFVRVPNWQERQQANELDLRQRANELAALNTIADNRRADAAASATEAYRNARLQQGTNRQPTTATLALSAARGDANAQKALELIQRSEGQLYTPAVQKRVDALSRGFDSQPIVKTVQKQAEAAAFAGSLDINTKNPADDQALIYSFAKAMDPDSVVREGEYATVQKYAQSWAERFGFDVKRVFSNTAFLTPQARENMKMTIRSKYVAGLSQYNNVRNEYARKISRATGRPGGEDDLIDYGAVFPSLEGSDGKPNKPFFDENQQ
jgi:hypothetical protein